MPGPYAKPLCPGGKVAQRGSLYQAHTPSLCVQVARWPSEGCSTRPIRQASVSRCQGGPAGVLRGASSSLGMLKKGSCARPNAKPLCPDAKWPSEGCSTRPIRQASVSRCQGGPARVLRQGEQSLKIKKR